MLTNFKILLGLGLLVASFAAENLTEVDKVDDAEFRQGGINQQLISGYSPGLGGIYGGTNGFQYMTNAGSGNGGSGYVNMLRNLYRPPSLGLTDKVKHWVKSFMNRRQVIKPYYNPSMSSLQYSPDEFGSKPVMIGGNSYKAISVPLRQLQKYYKPYYGSAENGGSQFAGSPPRSLQGNTAASSSMLSYSPGAGGAGLYASESTSGGQFAGSNSGLFSSPESSSALFGNSGASGGSLFSSSNPSGSYFASGNNGNIFSSGGSSSGIFSSGGSSGSIYSPNEGASSALFSAAGLPSSALYGSSGSPSSGLFQGSNQNSGSSIYSLDTGNSGLYGSSDSSSAFYGSSSGASGYGSNAAAASSILSSLNGGSNVGSYGDLFASGASPAATVYNPATGEQTRNYENSGSKKNSFGTSSSALYVSDQRNARENYPSKPQEQANSFNVDSGRNHPEPSYSVSFQPAQGKTYSSSFDNSGFQPVSYSSDEGFKGYQGKSS